MLKVLAQQAFCEIEPQLRRDHRQLLDEWEAVIAQAADAGEHGVHHGDWNVPGRPGERLGQVERVAFVSECSSSALWVDPAARAATAVSESGESSMRMIRSPRRSPRSARRDAREPTASGR